MDSKVMTPSGARRMTTSSMEALAMTNSVVILMKTIVRTITVSQYLVWGVMTLFMATLAMIT
jgi:hypothetical protein